MEKGQKLILIVEDDPNFTKAIQRILDSEGYSTLTASNGFEAGIHMGRYLPDLITLDINMPEMNGEEMLEIIRFTDYLSHLKILVISGLEEEKLQDMVDKGADDYLQKPYDTEVLLAKVQQLTA